MINEKMHLLTNDEITAYTEKEEMLKKAEEEAKLFEINMPETIKVVREEAKTLGIPVKVSITVKEGEKFKKAQDAEQDALKQEPIKKTKRAIELRQNRFNNYTWTMNNRLKPEKITDIKIHPNTKLVVLTDFRGTDKRILYVHNPFAFGAFGIFELDELREIIPRKKNVVVQSLMNSLGDKCDDGGWWYYYNKITEQSKWRIPDDVKVFNSTIPTTRKKATLKRSYFAKRHASSRKNDATTGTKVCLQIRSCSSMPAVSRFGKTLSRS
ncbi:retrovirus-related pol polyprotein from transposon TNT 1-94 [Tanacetum coccineum]